MAQQLWNKILVATMVAHGTARSERQASYDRVTYVPEFLLPADLNTLHGGRTPTRDNTEVRPNPRLRDAAHAKIAAFHRQHLIAAP